MKSKRFIRLACLCALAAILVIGYIAANFIPSKTQRAERIYSEVNSAISDHPDLPDSYGFAEYYLRNGADEYLILKNGQNTVSAARNQDGETVYYIDGKVWRVDSSGALEAYAQTQDAAFPILAETIHRLLAEQNVTYIADKNVGRDLLIGVGVNDWYITCDRAGFEEWDEYMACSKDDYGRYLVWHAISDSGTQLYMCLESNGNNHAESNDPYITYWGMLPSAVFAALFR